MNIPEFDQVCPNCGKQIPSGSQFCTFCGSRLIPKGMVKEAEGKEMVKQEAPAAKQAEKTTVTVKETSREQAAEKAAFDSRKRMEAMEKMELQDKTKNAVGLVERLYQNSGESLCWIAKFVFVFGAVISVLMGLGIMFSGCGTPYGGGDFFTGLLGMAVGVFASWLGSLGLYAFGDLVRRVKSIDEKLK